MIRYVSFGTAGLCVEGDDLDLLFAIPEGRKERTRYPSGRPWLNDPDDPRLLEVQQQFLVRAVAYAERR